MDTTNWEWDGSSLSAATGLVCDRDPRSNPWGFYATDASAGVFHWFVSPEEMHAFLRCYGAEMILGIWSDEDPREDEERVRGEVCRALDELDAGNASDDAALASINGLWSPINHEIPWWGEFRELARGEGEFGRDVNEWWCDGEARPIENTEELSAFVEALKEFGF